MKVLCYTRKELDDKLYGVKMARSMHLAIENEEGEFLPLHHNEGILYASATQNPDGTLNAKTLCEPRIFAKEDGTFEIYAIRLGDKGEGEEEQYILKYESADLIHYKECESMPFTDELYSEIFEDTGVFVDEAMTDIEGVVPGNIVEVSKKTADYLKAKLISPSYKEAFADEKAGTPHFDFPFLSDRADPCVKMWKGKYYFISTNDADGNNSIYIRESDTLSGLKDAEDIKILDTSMHEGIGGLLWAPEFHEINGRLYIFHAATKKEFYCEESRVMKLRKGGDITKSADWSAPHLVVKKDGSPLCEEGKVISLDMTTFVYDEKRYVMWSQRQFLPLDQGAWLYIAEIDENEPWKLVSDPVCIAKPVFSWENNHTFVVEGPFALYAKDKLMITYSAAATDTTYALGLLQIEKGKDILDPANWVKNNYPLMTSLSKEGEYGPGHNSFLTDEEGVLWIVYHARDGIEGPRSTGLRRVAFDVDGEPLLDITE